MTVSRETIENALTTTERERLNECEAVIARNLRGFVEAGEALATIRDGRLYRATHGTFEDYCGDKWGISRRRAYEFIEAAAVVENLCEISHIPLPANDAQARALSGLKPGTQREAWREAVDTAPEGKVTAAHVQAVADTYREETEDDRAAALLNQTFRKPIAQAPESPLEQVEEPPEEPKQEAIALTPQAEEYSGDDWYTPDAVMQAVREVIGAIELDPASNARANQSVRADTFYTREQDGLAQPWTARSLFCNPPYRRGLVAQFVQRLIDEHIAGNVAEAILLVNANTDSSWFQELFDYPICFWRGRLRFEAGDEHDGDRGTGMPARTGSAFVYFGPNSDKFRTVFARFGRVVQEM